MMEQKIWDKQRTTLLIEGILLIFSIIILNIMAYIKIKRIYITLLAIISFTILITISLQYVKYKYEANKQ